MARGACQGRAHRKSSRVIDHPPSVQRVPGNPYRAILRRDFPEPFIALLVFILGIWLWDHYFPEAVGYAPGTEEMALVKIDRDLRLADAMADDPPWLRWLAGVDDPRTVRRDALVVFAKLEKEDALTPRGDEARAIVRAVEKGEPLADAVRGRVISGFEETSRLLANHRGTWWQARLIESWEETARPYVHWRERHGKDALALRARALAGRGSVWLLGLAGLPFVAMTLRRLRDGLRVEQRGGYGGAWSMSLGLVVFIMATLAWIGFNMTLELGISALPGLHPAAGIFLDSAARLLPTLIALGLLFRQPSHAARVLGLDRPVAWRPVLGMFTLLMAVDLLLSRTLGGGLSTEPGGGLSAGEAGVWGLAFAVVSACLLAPFAEEVLYRGVLFRSFRNRLGVLPAALASSAIFAVLHFYDGYGLVSVGIFGLSCALLYAATGSLTTTIVLHALYNTAIKLPEWWIYHAPFR